MPKIGGHPTEETRKKMRAARQRRAAITQMRKEAMSAYHPYEIKFLEIIRELKHDVGYGRMLQIILYEWNQSHPSMTHRTVGDKNEKRFHEAKREDPIAPIAGWDKKA
jgi:hypothetical protein